MSVTAFFNAGQFTDGSLGLMIMNQDIADPTKYYGYVGLHGEYKIMKEILTDEAFPTYGYFFGTTVAQYKLDWAGRADLTYTYPDGTSL